MSGPARIVVLHHQGIEQPHFDLMIQPKPGAALLTWRCATWPPGLSAVEGPAIELTRLRDHRSQYLDYEGPVSGDRGQVLRTFSAQCQVTVGERQIDVREFDPPQAFARLELRQESGELWWLVVVD